ncbi:dienelactone hydrolase family protein [Jiangella endophytica]|uniref:dienelactone hydrolase family protein n=1 Tax=Jiangella endophytica TaxID=1623398 RepID=UPI000E351E21|nr:dienelactone hydrolase family protein [Jiangella endophytica]
MSERPVTIPVPGGGVVHADLTVPARAQGIVLFAHGSGSSRRSPRNRRVALALRQRGLATMLTDLLTETEGRDDLTTGEYRFDVGLLAGRLELAGRWLAGEPSAEGLPIGYFGASTGAAAALIAAARSRGRVAAVVSRGGRPDLATGHLADVDAPTLLIVGGDDEPVIGLSQDALRTMRCVRRMVIVPGAGHLFEEPGALDEVARLAGDWFITHLGTRDTA